MCRCCTYLRDQPQEADCVIVFDSLMADERTPAINTGARGLVQGPVEVRTGRRDLHSGLYGGAVLNATHVLMGILQEVLPGPDGRVREELRAGVASPSAEERESWARLPSGAEMMAEAGAAEVTPGAAEEFWERTGAEPAVDVNMLDERRAAHGDPVGGPRAAERAAGAGAERSADRGGGRAAAAGRGRRTVPRSRSSSTSPTPPCSMPASRRCSWPRERSSARVASRLPSCGWAEPCRFSRCWRSRARRPS